MWSIDNVENNDKGKFQRVLLKSNSGVLDKLKLWLKNSFLGRISEAEGRTNPMILQGSRVVWQTADLCKAFRKRFKNYLLASKTYILVNQLFRQLYFFSLRPAAGVIAAAILTNTIILMLLNEIGLWGYFMRGLLLFTAVALLFSGADWPAVKKSSLFLKLALKEKNVRHLRKNKF